MVAIGAYNVLHFMDTNKYTGQDVKTVTTFKYAHWLRRSRERCKQKNKNYLVEVDGSYWSDVRQEHTNKVERQSVQDGYKNRL